jgi:glycosyltransferase involved in cell wall biosynthesis
MLTVFIATYNRADTLSGTLQEFTRLQPPASGWKLVVVDNGCTDNTREVLDAFRDRLPLTYLYEGELGKNAALNTGLTQLEGDLAVFTDDDVFLRPDWLLRLRTAADENPEYTMFGGVIVPRWEVNPPVWLSCVPPAAYFSLTDPAWPEGPAEAGNLFGPNMAIRAEIFKNGTRFDPSIGPCGSSYPMGGETELVLRLARQEHKAWHVRDAVIEHYIRKDQLEKRWLLSRAIRHGRGQYRLARQHQAQNFSGWPWLAGYLAPRMCRRVVRIVIAWLMSNERELFTARREFNYNWGMLLESRRMRRLPGISGG